MNSAAPGLAWGSREWFDAVLTDCPEPLRPAIQAIALRWASEDADPNAMARLLLSETRKALVGVRHRLNSGALVRPCNVIINADAVSYTGLTAEGDVYVYLPGDIESTVQ